MKFLKLFLFLFLSVFVSCSLPRNIETGDAKNEVIIDGNTLILDTFLWRDFMPVAPPNGRNLIGQLLIHRPDNEKFSLLFEIQGVYIYDNDQWLWSVKPEEKRPHLNESNQVEVIVRDGPKLDTDLKVDVIIVLEHKDTQYLLKADDQTINRTY